MPIDQSATDDTEVEINLRPPREVAARLIVLGAVCRRAFLETQTEGQPDDDPDAERFDLTAWLRTEGLEGALTPSEARLLYTRVGHLSPDDAAAASWQTEALVALGWALGLLERMPPYDAAADPTPILAATPSPWDPATTFLTQALLRAEDAIAVERERAELWHWRSATADQFHVATRGDRRILTATVRDVAGEALAAGLLDRLASGDFPVRGEPYAALVPDAVADLDAVAHERLRALNWLCGFGTTWDDVPIDF